MNVQKTITDGPVTLGTLVQVSIRQWEREGYKEKDTNLRQ